VRLTIEGNSSFKAHESELTKSKGFYDLDCNLEKEKDTENSIKLLSI